MKKSILILLSFCVAQLLNAQPYNPDKINKKAVQLYNQAITRAVDGQLINAAGLLLKAIEADKKYVDAYISLGSIYTQLKNYKSSNDYYEKAFALDSNFTIDYKLPYSINLAGQGEFEKALAAINDLLLKKPVKTSTLYKNAEIRKRSFEFAVDFAKKNTNKDYIFTPKNIGAGINTSESEYFPSLTIDGKQLVFTRRLKGLNEDFFYSNKNNDEWDLAKPMEGNINTEMNEGAQNISQDGKWLVFTGCYRQDGYGGCDLYISYSTEQGWSEAVNLGGRVNSDQWESQPCLSPDKKDLYFASTRFGGYGGSDIYVCHLKTNGKWSDPENMGPEINTSGNEACPFIHADNQTLFFTSSGLQGYGGIDLFYVKKTITSEWGKPMNLGYPINTINDEGTLIIAANGKTAYYASDRSDSRGGMDIYSFELREDLRPVKTLWVKGKVTDKKTTKGLASSVELIDLATKQSISNIQTDENGNYFITLPVGKDYAFNVNHKGYLFYSDNFLLNGRTADSTYEKNIPLQPIETNASIVLKNIFFDVNKYELKPQSQVELDKLVQLLVDNPGLKIELSGHTDNVGKSADNMLLSNNRAKAVVNYLINKKINAARLTAKGYGDTKPIADNKKEDGKALNRRTELKVISQ